MNTDSRTVTRSIFCRKEQRARVGILAEGRYICTTCHPRQTMVIQVGLAGDRLR